MCRCIGAYGCECLDKSSEPELYEIEVEDAAARLVYGIELYLEQQCWKKGGCEPYMNDPIPPLMRSEGQPEDI